jgi:hypothetical protein
MLHEDMTRSGVPLTIRNSTQMLSEKLVLSWVCQSAIYGFVSWRKPAGRKVNLFLVQKIFRPTQYWEASCLMVSGSPQCYILDGCIASFKGRHRSADGMMKRN